MNHEGGDMEIGYQARLMTKIQNSRENEKNPLNRSHLLAALNFLSELDLMSAEYHVRQAGYESLL